METNKSYALNHKYRKSVWMSKDGVNQSFVFPVHEYDKRVKRLEKQGWKMLQPQPKGVFG